MQELVDLNKKHATFESAAKLPQCLIVVPPVWPDSNPGLKEIEEEFEAQKFGGRVSKAKHNGKGLFKFKWDNFSKTE